MKELPIVFFVLYGAAGAFGIRAEAESSLVPEMKIITELPADRYRSSTQDQRDLATRWPRYASTNPGRVAITQEPDGTTGLLFVRKTAYDANEAPLGKIDEDRCQAALLTVPADIAARITGLRYGIAGEVSYSDMREGGLGMETAFSKGGLSAPVDLWYGDLPGPLWGALDNQMGAIDSGTRGWGNFYLGFDRRNFTKSSLVPFVIKRIILQIKMGGAGMVHLRHLKLVQYPSGQFPQWLAPSGTVPVPQPMADADSDDLIPPGETLYELYWDHFPGGQYLKIGSLPYAPPAVANTVMDFDQPVDPYHPDKISLRIAYSGSGPLQLKLFPNENYEQLGQGIPRQVQTHHYAITGEVRYENVSPGSYLEMCSLFDPPPNYPGQPGAPFPAPAYFSRTLAESGPMGQLSGTSNWREFWLPFDSTGAKSQLAELNLNLHLTGPGIVHLRDMKLVQYADTAPPIAVQIPAVPEGHPSMLPTQRILTVAADGSMSIDGASYSSIDALRPILEAFQRSNQALVIRAASNAPYDEIAQVLDACKQAGLQRISLATMKSSGKTIMLFVLSVNPDGSIALFNFTKDGASGPIKNYPSIESLEPVLKDSRNANPPPLVFVLAGRDVPDGQLRGVTDACQNAGVQVNFIISHESLVQGWKRDVKSFLLGMLTTCLLFLAAAGAKLALTRWNQFRHARELRRIASLDT